MLPGNVTPVNGFLIAVVISEKFPWRISAVGTVLNGLEKASERTASYVPMKNVLLWPLYSLAGRPVRPSGRRSDCVASRSSAPRDSRNIRAN